MAQLERLGGADPPAPGSAVIENSRAEWLLLDADSERPSSPFVTELVVLRNVILVVYAALGIYGLIPVHPLALAGSAGWIAIINGQFMWAWWRKWHDNWYSEVYNYGDLLAVTFAILAVANLSFPIWLAYVMILIPASPEHPSRASSYIKGAFAIGSYLACALIIGLAGWQEINLGIVIVTTCLVAFIAYNLEVVFEGNRQLQATVRKLAVTDSLTGLSNRRQLSRFLGDPPRDKPLAVIIMDVDHFKQYNDAYGHLAGDQLLVRLASALQQEFADAVIISRYGGDEFVVMLPCWTIGEAEARIDHLLNGRPRDRVPVSVGLSLWPQHHASLDAAFAAADDCLRAAKRSQRGSFASTDASGAINLSDVP